MHVRVRAFFFNHVSIINMLTPASLPRCARPAADNLQHPGNYLHRRERPEATLPGPALRSLLQRPQSPQHGRRGPRQHQGERQRAAGGRRAHQQGRGAHHHLGAAGDVHHLHRDHHHALHHDNPQTALATNYSGECGGTRGIHGYSPLPGNKYRSPRDVHVVWVRFIFKE